MADFRIAVLDDYQRLAMRMADWHGVQQLAEVVVFDRHLPLHEAAAQLKDFDALCTMRERMALPRSLLQELPRLRLICITGAKHRTLDEQAAAELGITILAAEGGEDSRTATSELAWGLILALMRDVAHEAAGMRQGGWQTRCGRVIRGKTLGLVGLGNIGRQMVPVAKAFGMDVLAWSPNLTPEKAAAAGVTAVSKQELFARSDVVSLHLVLGERSRGTVGRAELAVMKPHAYLVNTARAGLVDSDALYEALVQGRIAGAALDVHHEEPLPPHDRFRSLDNVVLTPHLGYTTEETMRAFYGGVVRNLLGYLGQR